MQTGSLCLVFLGDHLTIVQIILRIFLREISVSNYDLRQNYYGWQRPHQSVSAAFASEFVSHSTRVSSSASNEDASYDCVHYHDYRTSS
jgi:hypothetical protein